MRLEPDCDWASCALDVFWVGHVSRGGLFLDYRSKAFRARVTQQSLKM